MFLSLTSVAGGLALLAVGAEVLVQGAASLARRLGLSPLVIGLTVVSIGTSLPELVVSVEAALVGSGGLALGNVVGSNIANIALILGVAALVAPIMVRAQVIRIDAPILLGVSLAFVALIWDGGLGRVDGAFLTTGIVAYVLYSLRLARQAPEAVQSEFDAGVPGHQSAWLDAGLLAIGIAGLVGGAHFLVDGAIAVAKSLGVSPVMIGLSVVAVGTSLPELATSVVAAWRGQGDIAVGNALGSSIFNLLGILGVTVLIHPLSTTSLGMTELVVMVGLAVIVLPFLRTAYTLSRTEGAVLLLSYFGYVAYLVLG